MKRIVVTGGAGFIGHYLCAHLLEAGHEVIVVDNFFSGRKANVTPLRKDFPDRFEVVRHDVTEPYHIECDQIYNLACPASPIYYQRNPIKTMWTGFVGTIHALDLALRCHAKILQASTSEVYGDPEVHPQVESYVGAVESLGSRSCYDNSKRLAETACWEYGNRHGLSVRIARIFNTYGPGMRPDDGRVMASFIDRALHGEELSVYGSGEQTRSFCYVDDTVRGLIALMDYDDCPNEAGACYMPFNLGNPEEITIADLAEKVVDFCYSGRLDSGKSDHRPPGSARPRIVRHPKATLASGDPKRRCPDITKAKKYLGWAPTISLDRGLARTVEWAMTAYRDDRKRQAGG